MTKPIRIVVIDAQGGGVGKQLIPAVKAAAPDAQVTAVGTNSAAAAAMRKAGADFSASGENAVVVACRTADVILGPIGIVIADAMLGEITPAMALAVGQSAAQRILIPFDRCSTLVAGVGEMSMGMLIKSAVKTLERVLS